jgi:hypothetical protein
MWGRPLRIELVGAVTERLWLRGLTAVLGGYYVFLGVDAKLLKELERENVRLKRIVDGVRVGAWSCFP